MRLQFIDIVLAVSIISAIALIFAIVLVGLPQMPQQALPHEALANLEQPSGMEGPETAVVKELVVQEPAKLVEVDLQSNNVAEAQIKSIQPQQDPRYNDPVFKEQLGRYALAFVGHDPEADAVWIRVINDPNLSANARRNLIEDLNEDGLSNYRNPASGDLPVILYRIQLIEQLAPAAMDQVNAEAFQEAYRDLLNLAAKLGAY